MERIGVIRAQVKNFLDERPGAREYCESPIFAKRGTAGKNVKDIHVERKSQKGQF